MIKSDFKYHIEETYLIRYIDPVTGEKKEVMNIFYPTSDISAREWAEDYAYNLVGKSESTVIKMLP